MLMKMANGTAHTVDEVLGSGKAAAGWAHAMWWVPSRTSCCEEKQDKFKAVVGLAKVAHPQDLTHDHQDCVGWGVGSGDG